MLPWFENGKFPLYLAPMARYTDVVYRELCKERGADVMVTEFVQANGIVHKVKRVWDTLDYSENQRPLGIQIFGSDPAVMAEAAKMLIDDKQPDFIDINFGCPADKVTCANAGSSMLRNLPLLQQVVKAVVKGAAPTPITAKIRIGWDENNIVALEAGQRIQDAGAQALTIHGRTKEQGYRGDANWPVIAEVANSLEIPVVGNGNIHNAIDVREARTNYGVSGVAIGRAALGYPWIFREIKHYLKTGEVLPPPTLKERWDLLIGFVELTAKLPQHSEHAGISWMRPKYVKLTKEMANCKKLRERMADLKTFDELLALRDEHIETHGEDQRGHAGWSETYALNNQPAFRQA